jgi:hypothetical protein
VARKAGAASERPGLARGPPNPSQSEVLQANVRHKFRCTDIMIWTDLRPRRRRRLSDVQSEASKAGPGVDPIQASGSERQPTVEEHLRRATEHKGGGGCLGASTLHKSLRRRAANTEPRAAGGPTSSSP